MKNRPFDSPPSSSTRAGNLSAVESRTRVLLETWFPSHELSQIIALDRRARDPAYAIHRWWARRPPTLLRALLLASYLPEGTSPQEFWDLFSKSEHILAGASVYDPFAGGGSTLVEAARLGAHVVGGDIDPIAVRIIKKALNPADPSALREAGTQMMEYLNDAYSDLYPSKSNRVPLHYFSIAVVTCPNCRKTNPLYKNLVLVRNVGKSGAVVRSSSLTVFCPDCFRLHHLESSSRERIHCCGSYHRINHGNFAGQAYHCPFCGSLSTHRDLQTGIAPRKLIAVEELVPGGYRYLRAPGKMDFDALRFSEIKWNRKRRHLPHPKGKVHTNRNDDRPQSYGIARYVEMFTPRQLVVLGHAFKWIRSASITSEVRASLELAVSNALSTNNRLCGYATDYGRISALFTVRGYSLPVLSIELNPLQSHAGRGSIHSCIERVARSADGEVRRNIWSYRTQKVLPHRYHFTRNGAKVDINLRNAIKRPLSRVNKVDIAVFDPPYFDYIAYDELSAFHRAWLDSESLAGKPLLPSGKSRVSNFGERFGSCLQAIFQRMHHGRPAAFTYHSSNPDAWQSVGIALDQAEARITALWPVRSDGYMGHHTFPGNSQWDVIVVCRPISDTKSTPLFATVGTWIKALGSIPVNAVDRTNFSLAVGMAADRFGVLISEIKP